MSMWPFGMMCSTPLKSRSVTARSVMRSTVPLLPAASITSPTTNWFSNRMKNPARKSLTMLWAPKETARLRMPKPVSRVLMLTKMTWRVSRIPTTRTTRRPTLRTRSAMVWPRCSAAVMVLSSPSSTAAMIRRAISLTPR